MFPGSSGLSVVRGNIQLTRGDTAAAEAAFREAIRRDTTNAEARGRLRAIGRQRQYHRERAVGFMHRRTLTVVVLLAALSPACAPPAMRPAVRAGEAIALSGGPNTSMIYLVRGPSGVVAIDLGWWGAERSVRRALRDLGASPHDVTDVFLTHSHRDHVGAWRLVRHSRFHVAAAERAPLADGRRHRGWIPRLAEGVKRSALPGPGEIEVRAFSRDTAFVFGADTLRAYVVPGHTAGSAVYLFRGILFLGDAATHTRWGGFAPARRGFSDDARTAARNLGALLARLPHGVRYACTAHAKCSPLTPEFLADVRR